MSRDYGIRISKPGVDVTRGEDKDMVFSSAYNSLKVAAKGTITSTGVGDTMTVDHNLGYEPSALAYFKRTSQGYDGYILDSWPFVEATDTQLLLRYTEVDDDISYIVFYDPADTGVVNYTGEQEKKYGMRVSQEGHNVHTVSDTKTSFLSEFRTLQIRDIFVSSAPTANNSVTITHNYGYPPAYLAQIKRDVGGGIFYYEEIPLVVDSFEDYTDTVFVESLNNTLKIWSGDADSSADTVRVVTFTESLE